MGDPKPIDVTINEKPVFEEVDAEIVVIAGCALGFVSKSSPPHVLHIETSSVLDKNGITMDDILYKVNDHPVGNPFLGKDEIMTRLTEKLPLTLSFVKPADAAIFLPNYNKADVEAAANEDEDGSEEETPPVEDKKEKKRRKRDASGNRDQRDRRASREPAGRDPRIIRGPFGDDDTDDERDRKGIRDSWTIRRGPNANTARRNHDLDQHHPGDSGSGPKQVILLERNKNYQPHQGELQHHRGNIPAGVQVGGVWMPPGRVPHYMADRPMGDGMGKGEGGHMGAGGGGPRMGHRDDKGGGKHSDTDTVLVQNLPPHLRSLVALTPILAEMGFTDIRNMRSMSQNTAMAIAFDSPLRAQDFLRAIQAQGHFAGDPAINARPYFQNKNKGGRDGRGGKGGEGRGGRENHGNENGGGNGNWEEGKGGSSSSGQHGNRDRNRGSSANQQATLTDNQTLENAELANKRKQKSELDEKKKVLIGHVTERMQQVLKRMNQLSLSAEQKAKFSQILAGLKQKLTTLTELDSKRKAAAAAAAAAAQGWGPGQADGSHHAQAAAAAGSGHLELQIHLKTNDNAFSNMAPLEVLHTFGLHQIPEAHWDTSKLLTEETRHRPELPPIPSSTDQLPPMGDDESEEHKQERLRQAVLAATEQQQLLLAKEYPTITAKLGNQETLESVLEAIEKKPEMHNALAVTMVSASAGGAGGPAATTAGADIASPSMGAVPAPPADGGEATAGGAMALAEHQ